MKNKLFYFGDYLRDWTTKPTRTSLSIPAMDLRTGNFSALYHAHCDMIPLTADQDRNGSGRTPFRWQYHPALPDRPDLRQDLRADAAADSPLPPRPTNNYFGLLPFTKDTDHVDAKMD